MLYLVELDQLFCVQMSPSERRLIYAIPPSGTLAVGDFVEHFYGYVAAKA